MDDFLLVVGQKTLRWIGFIQSWYWEITTLKSVLLQQRYQHSLELCY